MITLAIILTAVVSGIAGYFFREYKYKRNPPTVIMNADLIKGDGGRPILECHGGWVDVVITSNTIEYNTPK